MPKVGDRIPTDQVRASSAELASLARRTNKVEGPHANTNYVSPPKRHRSRKRR